MSYLPVAELGEPEIAFALSRRFGNAVQRNRGRRRLKAAFGEAWHQATDRPQPGAFLLTGSHRLLTDDYQALVADVNHCLARLAPATTKLGARS